MRLHAHYIDGVILTPVAADTVDVLSSSLILSVGFPIQDEAMDVAQSTLQGVITMWTLLTCALDWELWRENKADGKPGKAYTNSVFDHNSLYSGEQHMFVFYTKCVTSVRAVNRHCFTHMKMAEEEEEAHPGR